MRLLIITQAIDKNDPVLGFFHGWVSEFSKKFEAISIICLRKGECSMPKNVTVFSLGKDRAVSGQWSVVSKILYTLRFYKLIWRTRKEYDAVFVHMNQEYVLLAGVLWKLLGKKLVMWRNHGSGSWFTNVAVALCDKVFCTSKYSYTAKFKKTVLMPVGIDTNIYKPSTEPKIPKSILYVGRVAPIKNVHLLVDAVTEITKDDPEIVCSIVGPDDSRFPDYLPSLKEKVKKAGMDSKIIFIGPKSPQETLKYFQSHELLVNLSPNGMYDKVIFEAMVCGCLPISSNLHLRDELPKILNVQKVDVDTVREKISSILHMPYPERTNLYSVCYRFVQAKHSLTSLSEKLHEQIAQA